MGRSRAILARFPAHFEAAREGKRLDDVTQALALDLDTLSAALARVRRAHRLLDADELRDLLRIAGVHGITSAELAILFARFDLARSLVDDAAGSDPAAEQLLALWGIAVPAPRLPRYTPRESVVAFARRAVANDVFLDAIRTRIRTICAAHARGNGTIDSVLTGAANALDLEIAAVQHSPDRYLHVADVVDRLRIAHPQEADGKAVRREFDPAEERLLVEENPLSPVRTSDEGRKHGDLFSILRRGFERETLRVIITGVEQRTLGPVLVNRDEGHGVGFVGAVPSESTLAFTEEGRVTLDSADVTSMAYAWQGACFADAAAPRRTDFVFDGSGADPSRRAVFAVATPAGALGSEFTFPHAGENLPMPGISVGETRFAFFVQEGRFSRLDAGPPERVDRVQPRPAMAFFDQSVLAPGPSEKRPAAAVVSLGWDERTAFYVNVWIPKRFRALTPDDEEGRSTLEQVAFALNRFRPAGVHVEVKFLDDRWVLGRGIMIDEDDAGEVAGPGSGTELWTAPADQG